MLTATTGFKIFPKVNELKYIHCSFLELANQELRLAVFNFLPIFSLICC